MTSEYSLIKTWTLLRYAVEISHPSVSSSPSNERQQIQRQTLDCSEGPLHLNFTATQQLYIIRDETEKIECVDLSLSNSSSIFATYTGDSLLISYIVPGDNIQRKFLIKFASTNIQNGYQHCEDCINLLSRLIKITHYDSMSMSSTLNPIEKSSSIVTTTDMIKALMGDNTITLSTYYHQQISFDLDEKNEFLEKYLCDETFPDFVANVASILDSLKEM